MQRVYKYEIPVLFSPTIQLPKGAEVLSVHEQAGRIFMWALVDPTESITQKRRFLVAGTGHDISFDANHEFIGSVHMHIGSLVFHVFEVDL